jgi:hypothetical protein
VNNERTTDEQRVNTVEESKERKKKDAPSPKTRFVKPTEEEVSAYCLTRKNGIDPAYFRDHYEANGWVQSGGKPIRNWKAAVRTWERNGMAGGRNRKPQRQRCTTAAEGTFWNPQDAGEGAIADAVAAGVLDEDGNWLIPEGDPRRNGT